MNTHACTHVDIVTHNYTQIDTCLDIHTTTHTHPWKKTLALRPHRVHVSPSGIINTMLMNIVLGHVERGERERYWKKGRERGQKVGGWRRIMDSLLTTALPEVLVGGKHASEKQNENGVIGGGEARESDHTKMGVLKCNRP